MLVVIVGCGRMGSLVANSLSRKGNDVIIIDADENSFKAVTNDFSGFQFVGDATQVETLKMAKIGDAKVLFVLTGDDNINLMVAQVGKMVYNVPHVMARVMDPSREQMFRKLGIETICPTRLSVSILTDMVENLDQAMKDLGIAK